MRRSIAYYIRGTASGLAFLGGLLLLAGTPGFGQQETALPADLTTLIGPFVALEPKQIAAVERGEPVTISIAPPDHNEVAILGLVAVDVPRAFYLTRTTDLSGFAPGPARSAFGMFHEPATSADAAALALDASDVDALKKCRPSHCQMKLPGEMMDRLRQSVNWSGDPAPQVNGIMRDWLPGLANDYRARGDDALPVYEDTRRAERSADGARQLLDEDAPLLRGVPSFSGYLRQSTPVLPLGATTSIYWSVDHRPGVKPILSIGQLSRYSPADPKAPAYVAMKLLYASHYFDSFLDVTALVDRAAPRAGTYVLLVRRARFDDLPSGGLLNIRGRVARKFRDGARDELAELKRTMEAAYGAGSGKSI